MNSFLIPIVFFCAFTPGEPHECNGQTALYKHALSPIIQEKVTEDGEEVTVEINTPLLCLKAGWMDVAKEIQEFQKEHPKKDLEFRVICKRTEQRT